VARNYVELRGLQRQRAIARANIESQRQTLEVTESKFKAGISGELDSQRAAAQVASSEARIPEIEAGIFRAIHRLSVLQGREPAALAEELSKEEAMPAPDAGVPAGLPSELLRRRPDIRRAERQLAASTARIGVATADLFPKFSLTGSIGLQSSELRDLGSLDSGFWSFGPSMRWPVFHGGQIRANIAAADARQESALQQYERTVLGALEEVENALVDYSRQRRRREKLAQSVKASRRAFELANGLYVDRVGDFLDVLEAQRTLFAAEDALAQSEKSVLANRVAIYKALGGGWETAGGRD
jgi:NodT family efflux transporter outer membrane factor (OMF) lipoprotein